MQQILPIFPDETRMVNYQVGFKQMDDFVHYFVNGMPVYCHEKDDKNGYRFVLASLVNHNFCSIKELSDALGAPRKNIVGIAATRIENRVFAALGLQKSDISFDSCESIEYGGVLFLLPFLLANGLLSYKQYYSERLSGYYDFDSAILTLAFMYLCRVKSVEQLKHNGIKMREVRKLTGTGHQTSVITTNYKIPAVLIALYMRKARRQAKLYALKTENIEGEMEQTGKNIEKQLCISQEIELLETEEQEILVQRKQHPEII